MIEIDGAMGEGGGQIIRSALTLAALLGEEVVIRNVRANRNPPGLRPQHLTAARAVRKVCRGALEAELGGRELRFKSGPIVGGRYEFKICTAGSAVLVAQTLLPILLRANKKSEVRIIGGTHVSHAPTYEYFEHVFLRAIRALGAKVESRLLKPGFYPKGGGVIALKVEPSSLSGLVFERIEEETQVEIVLGSLPFAIALREKKVFWDREIYKVRIKEYETLSPGNAITAWSGFRGSAVLGEKGKRAERVAQECLGALEEEVGAVDRHLADQLMLYGAVASGFIEYTTSAITSHAKTNAEVLRLFGVNIAIEGKKVRVEGI